MYAGDMRAPCDKFGGACLLVAVVLSKEGQRHERGWNDGAHTDRLDMMK